VRITCALAEIQTEYLPNTPQTRYCCLSLLHFRSRTNDSALIAVLDLYLAIYELQYTVQWYVTASLWVRVRTSKAKNIKQQNTYIQNKEQVHNSSLIYLRANSTVQGSNKNTLEIGL
jgi:uncharacterized membrane protein YciS (DUF1049 family)